MCFVCTDAVCIGACVLVVVVELSLVCVGAVVVADGGGFEDLEIF